MKRTYRLYLVSLEGQARAESVATAQFPAWAGDWNIVSRAKKLLLAVPIFVVGAVGFWWLDANVFVSAEMKELRGIESSLDLPAHVGRSENDSGEHTDWKGARHNDRYILLYFGYRDSMDDIVTIFESNDWVLERKTEREPVPPEDGGPIGGETRWRFASDSEPACASIWRDTESSGDISDSGVFLRHTSSDACQ